MQSKIKYIYSEEFKTNKELFTKEELIKIYNKKLSEIMIELAKELKR